VGLASFSFQQHIQLYDCLLRDINAGELDLLFIPGNSRGRHRRRRKRIVKLAHRTHIHHLYLHYVVLHPQPVHFRYREQVFGAEDEDGGHG
jgi:hypothetical protein